jgi:thiol:disulfide interchange protein DsbD
VIARLVTALCLLLALAAPAAAAPVQTGHIEAELVAASRTVAPGQTVQAAVRQKLAEGWHTYWRNAGDSGAPPEIRWTLPKGWTASGFSWPAPLRLRESTLMTYGYEGEVWLPLTLTVPADARVGETARLAAAVDFLVCADICIPESAALTLDLPVAAAAEPSAAADALARAAARIPRPLPGGAAAVTLSGGVVRLGVAAPVLMGADVSGAYFFPYSQTAVLHPQPQTIERGPDGLTLTLKPGRDFASGAAAPLSGVLQTRGGAWEIDAAPGPLPTGAGGLGPAPSADEVAARPADQIAPARLPVAVLFALLGGLVLNLMPCVFPVLSMKAAHLAERAHAPTAARADGLAFLAGSLAAFLSLALLLVLGKAAGQSLGWGFQLQSPATTAFLSVLTLAIALNLSGVYDAGASLQGLGAGLTRKGGPLGAFFTGVLAVVLGAPCTAPFMATAIGYALTAGAAETLLVFAGLGLGLALPFTLLCFSPALLRRLPRPGPWMDGLRRLLAFPMYGTAAFMAWVFAQQTGSGAFGALLGAAVLLALALHLYGGAQPALMAGARPWPRLAAAVLALAAALALTVSAGSAPVAQRERGTASAALPEEPWSSARVAELQAQGKPVFVNFTAAWCVTCKVNEQVAFADPKVAAAFKRTGAAYLVADWTSRDATIAAALQAYGRPGVPLYLVFTPGVERAQVLPQILTAGTVVRALDRAAARNS